ncbi:MAG TPA: hypothetical protein VGW74_10570 [Propionibacteriaceae bacterium]|nr:hypothetical protein [Propionibacteriaceae bacterium]
MPDPEAHPIVPLADDPGFLRAVEAGGEALRVRGDELRDLHHAHAALDANARHWVATAVLGAAHRAGTIRLPGRVMVPHERLAAEVVQRVAAEVALEATERALRDLVAEVMPHPPAAAVEAEVARRVGKAWDDVLDAEDGRREAGGTL